ncbi:signal peptidase II [Conexibacter sp. W3-3-2]|uniref:signal peptidase II n=1 Tax=Conexibacter sp. W3-3-2 TaxID=2675227 RepID=UPI0018AA19DC|nr:signal peptidase II [Conexibacter sp. W3-3-2]
MRISGQGWVLRWALLAAATDWLTKVVAEQTMPPGVGLPLGARLDLSHNTGVAFGGLSGAPDGVVLGVVAVGIAGLGWAVVSGVLPGGIAGGLLLGGAIANLVDRLEGGGVTDFIDVGAWPSFNLADVYLTVGVALVLLSAVRPAESRDRSLRAPD